MVTCGTYIHSPSLLPPGPRDQAWPQQLKVWPLPRGPVSLGVTPAFRLLPVTLPCTPSALAGPRALLTPCACYPHSQPCCPPGSSPGSYPWLGAGQSWGCPSPSCPAPPFSLPKVAPTGGGQGDGLWPEPSERQTCSRLLREVSTSLSSGACLENPGLGSHRGVASSKTSHREPLGKFSKGPLWGKAPRPCV